MPTADAMVPTELDIRRHKADREPKETTMAIRITLTVAAATLALLTPATARAADGLDVFARRVAGYVELHRRAAAAFPPPHLTADYEQTRRATDALAAAVKAARPGAQCGDIFVAEAGDIIRARVAAVIAEREYDVALMRRAWRRDHAPQPAVVNERFPWPGGDPLWPLLLWELPPLPRELEYRFVDRDLVLLDVAADLVVDVLPAVLPLQ